MDPDLRWILEVLAVVLVPFLGLGLLLMLLKKPLLRWLGRVTDAAVDHVVPGGRANFSFSLGGIPGHGGETPAGPTATLGMPDDTPAEAIQSPSSVDPEIRREFSVRWLRALDAFAGAPDVAVREAHQAASELLQRLNIPQARLAHVASADLLTGADPLALLRGVRSQMESTRLAAHGINAALAFRQTEAEDLKEAMALYGRVFTNLLGTSRPDAPAPPEPQDPSLAIARSASA